GSVTGDAAREPVHHGNHAEVRGDRGEMPAERLEAEGRPVQQQPKEKNRTVVVARPGRVDVAPDVVREVSGCKVPGLNRGIVHDLRQVVVDELELERADVSDDGE